MKKILAAIVLMVSLAFSIGVFANDDYVSAPNISVTTSTGSAAFTLKSDTKDAYIYYTTNGKDPTTSSTRYSSKVTVKETCEVRAVAYDRVEKEYSEVGYYLVTVTKERAATPTATATAVAGGKKITLKSSTSSASIYYTLDGTTPTTSSKKYTSSGITVTDDATIKAIAVKSGYADSKVVTINVSVPELAAPKITLTTSSGTNKVTLSCSTSGATIYYTTNGANPTTSSKKYSSAITITSDVTLKAVAYKNGYKKSDVSEKDIEGSALAKPTGAIASVAGGKKVTLSAASGATIYYTTDGSNPTTSSKKYTSSGITITKEGTTQVKAIAYKSGSKTSGVLSFEVSLVQTSSPTIKTTESTSGTKVTLSASSGSTIYYTTNGATPTTSSKKYSSAFTVTSSCTVKAIAVRSGYAVSEVEEEEIRSTASAPKLDSKTAVAGGYTVKLSASSGSTIYYTIDGGDPTKTGRKTYSSSGIKITTVGTTYIRAVAYKSGSYSEEEQFDVTVGKLSAPKAEVVSSSTTSSGKKIALTGPSGATIYYTTNGTTPTTSSKKYTSAFTLTAPCKVMAIAVRNGYANSAVYAGNVTFKVETPTASYTKYAKYTKATFKCTTSGAKIYYTLDGRDPLTYGKAVSSGSTITINESCVLQYAAKKSGYSDSNIKKANISIGDDVITLENSDEIEIKTGNDDEISFELEDIVFDYEGLENLD